MENLPSVTVWLGAYEQRWHPISQGGHRRAYAGAACRRHSALLLGGAVTLGLFPVGTFLMAGPSALPYWIVQSEGGPYVPPPERSFEFPSVRLYLTTHADAPQNIERASVTLAVFQPVMSAWSRAMQKMLKTSQDERISKEETRVLKGILQDAPA